MAQKRFTVNENEACLLHIILDTMRLKGWEKSGLGSMTFKDMCKLDSRLDKWIHTKVFGEVWTEDEGWIDPHPVITDDFNPVYDTDEWQ